MDIELSVLLLDLMHCAKVDTAVVKPLPPPAPRQKRWRPHASAALAPAFVLQQGSQKPPPWLLCHSAMCALTRLTMLGQADQCSCSFSSESLLHQLLDALMPEMFTGDGSHYS